jgi:hypothetical protein
MAGNSARLRLFDQLLRLSLAVGAINNQQFVRKMCVERF